MKTTVNYKRIKREIIKRDTGLDARFTTKVSKSSKEYNRQKEKRVSF
jgi:hypothetical protein